MIINAATFAVQGQCMLGSGGEAGSGGNGKVLGPVIPLEGAFLWKVETSVQPPSQDVGLSLKRYKEDWTQFAHWLDYAYVSFLEEKRSLHVFWFCSKGK